jgi:hypothetical protein
MSRDEVAIEAEIQSKGLNAPRLNPAHIDEQIVAEYVTRASDAFPGAPIHDSLKCLTLCVLVLKNGYVVTGESACASPANFDAEIGRKIARDNARNKIWALEGYLLRSKLAAS